MGSRLFNKTCSSERALPTAAVLPLCRSNGLTGSVEEALEEHKRLQDRVLIIISLTATALRAPLRRDQVLGGILFCHSEGGILRERERERERERDREKRERGTQKKKKTINTYRYR